jgi:hypothetical protein
MWFPKDMPLVDTQSEPPLEKPKSSATAHRLGYFLWSRRAAKCLWFLCAAFWGGGAASLFVPAVESLYDNAVAGLLYSILFPPLVFLYLAIGWARQEIDAGRIVLGPAIPPRDRSVGGWSDPAADPLDPRSPNHISYIRSLHE